MRRSFLAGVLLASCAAGLGFGQQPVAPEMTMADLRAYMDALHVVDADAKGVRAQMILQKPQLPPWWPQDVFDDMVTAMLKVDLTAINYPFVKSCMSEPDLQVMTHFWSTPGGDAYGRKLTGGMIAKEATGTTANDAREEERQEDAGMPESALADLSPEERKTLLRLMTGPAKACLNEGFQKAGPAVSAERTRVVRELIEQRRPQLLAAKEKYEAAQPGPAPK